MSLEEAIAFLRGQIADYKLPETIERFEEFPVNRDGQDTTACASRFGLGALTRPPRRVVRLTGPNRLQRKSQVTRAGVSRAIKQLPPQVARRRLLPTMLLRRHIDELRGDGHGTMGP